MIRNFFEGKCDAREAAIVQAWLNEWENFQPADALSPELSGKLWNNINKNSPSPRHSYFKWIAVAASVVLVLGLSWQFILKKQKAGVTSAAAIAGIKDVVNTTSQKMMLTLGDSSTVELFPNSTLSYPENFDPRKREVTLDGEATFNIAKDIARPFSVTSRSVLITVLGTSFTVNSYDSDKATKVILHEGKIKVKMSDPSSKDNRIEYSLAPGDIFISKKARVLHLEKDKDDGYVFNNYPLDVVFDQLQIIYNEKIVYNKAELGNRTFIGKIDKKDPLSHILKSITLLTNFNLHKQGDSFIISAANLH